MSSEIEKAYEYCRGVTRFHAKSFYFAAKFLPEAKRRAVYPIYAFCRHVDDEIDELGENVSEAEAARTVDEWRANLELVYMAAESSASETFPQVSREQSFVMLAWSDLLKQHKIPKKLPLELVQGVLMDTTTKRYETFEELYVYCYRVASTVGLMSSEILGYADPVALEYAEAMGIGMQLTNILRDVGEDAEKGRIYLPQEDLRRFGITEDQFFSKRFDSAFERLIAFEIDRARTFYVTGEKGIAKLDRDSRFTVLLASRTYGGILTQIEKLGRNVFHARARTTRLQKIMAIPFVWLASKNFR